MSVQGDEEGMDEQDQQRHQDSRAGSIPGERQPHQAEGAGSSPRPALHHLLTLGYANVPVAALEGLMTKHTKVTLADVRWKPYSRDPDWQEAALRKRFGRRYVHVKELGNVNYRGPGPIRLQDADRGMAILHSLLREGPVVILCGCWNLRECHRNVVSELANRRFGVTVSHLTAHYVKQFLPPPAPPAQMSMF